MQTGETSHLKISPNDQSHCRNKSIMEAEAEAEAVALKGDAEAYAIEINAKAEVCGPDVPDVDIGRLG